MRNKITNKKKNLIKKLTSMVLALSLTMAGMLISPTIARAAGWLEYAQDLSLGTSVHGIMKQNDYTGILENGYSRNYAYYWHIYRFSMPQNGFLSIYLESEDKEYFYNDLGYTADKYNGVAIFSGSDPDTLVWRSYYSGPGQIQRDYSSAREMYYGSKEIALEQGEYYFALRYLGASNAPYYLTLSYKEPNVNVTSISLDKKSLKLEPGEQATLTANVLPDNATDKTVTWESSDDSVASVENGTVTARAAGTASITASSADGEITASCQVTVIDTALIDAFEEAKPTITSITPGRKKATVYFSSISSYGVKYQIAYRTGSGKWQIKNTASTSTTIRSLKSKRTYFIRVRGYNQFYGKTYYSSWSKVQKIKVQ